MHQVCCFASWQHHYSTSSAALLLLMLLTKMCYIVKDNTIFDGNLSKPTASNATYFYLLYTSSSSLVLFSNSLFFLRLFNFYLCTFGCTPAHSEARLNGNFLGSNYGRTIFGFFLVLLFRSFFLVLVMHAVASPTFICGRMK